MESGLDAFNHIQQSIIGLPVSHAWRGYGTALFVEFGTLQPTTLRNASPGHPEGEFGLMIEWSWRIEVGTSICCGSWSDADLWQPAFDQLLGHRVIGMATFGRLPEIAVALTDDVHILSFMTAEGDPEWTVFDRVHGRSRWIGVQAGVLHASAGRGLGPAAPAGPGQSPGLPLTT